MIEGPKSARRVYSPREKLEIVLEGTAAGNIAGIARDCQGRYPGFGTWDAHRIGSAFPVAQPMG